MASRCTAGCRPLAGRAATRRRLRSDDARVDRHSRPRCGGERRLFPRQHDRGGRHLRRRQERHGAAVHRRRRAPRRAEPHAHARRAGAAGAAEREEHRDRSQPQIDRVSCGCSTTLRRKSRSITHFHNIEQIVEEFQPKRVVLDSLSTYGSNLGTQAASSATSFTRSSR